MTSPQETARAFLMRHGLTPPIDYQELLDACEQDGIRVVLVLRPLACRAVCVTGGRHPVIVLSPEVFGDTWVLAHETSHALNDALAPPGLWAAAYTCEEAGAEAFAAALLDPNPH